MERLFTIGAYGWDAEMFFGALEREGIDLFLDLRRRRGIRGGLYSFGNVSRLQEELGGRGIAYRHLIELAPDEETREIQNRADAASQKAKRQRQALDAGFVREYTRRTVEPFDWGSLAEELKTSRRPVLFCVERTPEACHRHLVAERLAAASGVPVTDLLP
jgi:uncharacterized protein (DUF488 family)